MGELSVDVDEWYRVGVQHQSLSEEIDRWAERLDERLADFPRVYGTFFSRSHSVFANYSAVSKEVARHLAERHRQTGEAVYEVAENFQEADAHGG